MIKVTIERTKTVEWLEKENLVTKETPTDKVETTTGSYGGQRVLMEKEYAVAEVTKRTQVKTMLLEQEIEDDNFDLSAVIKAVNKL